MNPITRVARAITRKSCEGPAPPGAHDGLAPLLARWLELQGGDLPLDGCDCDDCALIHETRAALAAVDARTAEHARLRAIERAALALDRHVRHELGAAYPPREVPAHRVGATWAGSRYQPAVILIDAAPFVALHEALRREP